MSDWIEWHGGECPVAPHTTVRMKLRNGEIKEASAWRYVWYHCSTHADIDIIAYQIISQPKTSNPVTSPAHYTAGEIECIDAIRAALTDEEFRGFCKGNVIKYTWRERHKGGSESLAKAIWYLERLIK